MSSWLIIVTGLIYFYISAEQAIKGDYGLACMYAGYCLPIMVLILLLQNEQK